LQKTDFFPLRLLSLESTFEGGLPTSDHHH